MKNVNKVIMSAIVLAAFTTSANAQNTADEASASASARIVTAISIEKNDDLVFGNIIRGTGGGTVTIAANSVGERTAGGTGNTIVLAGAVGTYKAAKFTVTGDGAATYAITRTPALASNLELTGPTGTTAMQATLVVSAGGTGSETTTGVLNGVNGGSGEQEIFVGGTLTVAADQGSGLYTVTDGITISVDYN